MKCRLLHHVQRDPLMASSEWIDAAPQHGGVDKVMNGKKNHLLFSHWRCSQRQAPTPLAAAGADLTLFVEFAISVDSLFASSVA